MSTSLELLTQLRQRLKDFGGATVDPDLWKTDSSHCLWTNEELYGHLADAEAEFCTRRPIKGKFNIDLKASEPEYRLPDWVYTVEDVVLESTNDPLICFNHHTEPALREQTFDAPTWYAVDLREQRLRVYPTPLEADRLIIRVYRLPTARLSATRQPEIQSQHHRYLLDWACFLAYQKSGADSLDYDQAAHYRSRFDAAVGPQISVDHQEIRRDIANRRLRTTAYYR